VLAIALVQRHYGEAVARAMVIPLFFAGALCGALLVESIENRRQVARAFLIEALLLILFAVLAWMDDRVLSHAIPQGALLLLLAGSMGLQNAAVAHRGTGATHTTHITGPLTDLASELVGLMLPRRRHTFRPSELRRVVARLVGFAVGALCGAAFFSTVPLAAPVLGAVTLIGLAAFDGS
jgi:uncharacterized membrane protein YoaK (UPF0700 family)